MTEVSDTPMNSDNTSLTTEQEHKKILPITILSGFLGAGKTTLLRSILRNKENLRVAVIVNDMAENASLVKNDKVIAQPKMVQMQNGCICCTLREDFIDELRKLAEAGEFDYCVIESTGISEPMNVAEAFTFALEGNEDEEYEEEENADVEEDAEDYCENEEEEYDGPILSDIARLDTCVTVVDAKNFYTDLKSVEKLSERYKDQEVSESDEKNLCHLLIDQIEFADVILLNKIDLVSEDEIKEIRAIIFKLNPLAKIIHTTHSNVDLKEIINTGLFNFDKAATNPGWLKEIKKETSESVEYGISSFVYRRRKPFHTQKLYDLVMSQDSKLIKHSGVIRSKGYMWLCTRHDSYGDWEHAGSLIDLNDGGNFFAALGDAYIDELFDEQGAREVRADFQGKYGDRRQELVFIGKDMSREAIEKMLDDCLLTEEEFAMGPGAWLTITDDKFNAWNEEGDDDDEWETDDEEEENVE